MTSAARKKSLKFQDLVIISTIIHIVCFVIIPQLLGLSLKSPRVAPVYYVDLVNLPVANPQQGAPTASEEAPQKSKPAPQPPEAVRLPEKTTESKLATKKPDQPKESDREFAERLANLAEARRQESAVAQLRNKLAAKKQPQGMPTGKGSEAGSDYAAYLQSRLKDAFQQTIAMQSRNPEVVVKISVSRSGKITGYRVERTSGDRVFENAVARAIQLAGRHFPPPPDNDDFEGGFVFRPQGVNPKI